MSKKQYPCLVLVLSLLLVGSWVSVVSAAAMPADSLSSVQESMVVGAGTACSFAEGLSFGLGVAGVFGCFGCGVAALVIAGGTMVLC